MIETKWEMINKLPIWAKSFGRKTICARFDQTAISMESSGYRLPREFQQNVIFIKKLYNREILRMSEFITGGLNGKLPTNCRSRSKNKNT